MVNERIKKTVTDLGNENEELIIQLQQKTEENEKLQAELSKVKGSLDKASKELAKTQELSQNREEELNGLIEEERQKKMNLVVSKSTGIKEEFNKNRANERELKSLKEKYAQEKGDFQKRIAKLQGEKTKVEKELAELKKSITSDKSKKNLETQVSRLTKELDTVTKSRDIYQEKYRKATENISREPSLYSKTPNESKESINSYSPRSRKNISSIGRGVKKIFTPKNKKKEVKNDKSLSDELGAAFGGVSSQNNSSFFDNEKLEILSIVDDSEFGTESSSTSHWRESSGSSASNDTPLTSYNNSEFGSDAGSLSDFKRFSNSTTIKAREVGGKFFIADEENNTDENIESDYRHVKEQLETARGKIQDLEEKNQHQLTILKNQEEEIEKLKLSEQHKNLKRSLSSPGLKSLAKTAEKTKELAGTFSTKLTRKPSKKDLKNNISVLEAENSFLAEENLKKQYEVLRNKEILKATERRLDEEEKEVRNLLLEWRERVKNGATNGATVIYGVKVDGRIIEKDEKLRTYITIITGEEMDEKKKKRLSLVIDDCLNERKEDETATQKNEKHFFDSQLNEKELIIDKLKADLKEVNKFKEKQEKEWEQEKEQIAEYLEKQVRFVNELEEQKKNLLSLVEENNTKEISTLLEKIDDKLEATKIDWQIIRNGVKLKDFPHFWHEACVAFENREESLSDDEGEDFGLDSDFLKMLEGAAELSKKALDPCDEVILAVNTHWEEKADEDGLINGRDQETVLGASNATLRTNLNKFNITELNNEKLHLINLIDDAANFDESSSNIIVLREKTTEEWKKEFNSFFKTLDEKLASKFSDLDKDILEKERVENLLEKFAHGLREFEELLFDLGQNGENLDKQATEKIKERILKLKSAAEMLNVGTQTFEESVFNWISKSVEDPELVEKISEVCYSYLKKLAFEARIEEWKSKVKDFVVNHYQQNKTVYKYAGMGLATTATAATIYYNSPEEINHLVTSVSNLTGNNIASLGKTVSSLAAAAFSSKTVFPLWKQKDAQTSNNNLLSQQDQEFYEKTISELEWFLQGNQTQFSQLHNNNLQQKWETEGERDALKKKIATYRTDYKKESDAKNQLAQQSSQQQKFIDRLTKLITKKINLNRQLKELVGTKELTNQEKASKITRLTKKLNKTEQKEQLLLNGLEILHTEWQTNAGALNEKRTLINDLQTINQQLAHDLEIAQNTWQTNQLSEQLVAVQTNLTLTEKENDNLHIQLTNLQNSYNQTEQELFEQRNAHNETKTNLAKWKGTFSSQSPLQVAEKITNLEQELTETLSSKTELEEKYNTVQTDLLEEQKAHNQTKKAWELTNNDILASRNEHQQLNETLTMEKVAHQKTRDNLTSWKELFDKNITLFQAQTEVKELKNRPNIPLTNEQWDKDYQHRPTKDQLTEAVTAKEKEFQNFIDPTNITALKTAGLTVGLVDPVNYIHKTTYQQDLQVVKKQLEQVNNDLTAARDDQNQAEKKLANMQDDWNKVIHELNVRPNITLAEYNQEKQDAMANLVKARKDLKTWTEKFSGTPEEIKNNLQSLRNQLEEKNNFVDSTNYFLKTELEFEAKKAGWVYTQQDLEEAIIKAIIDPSSYLLKTDTHAIKEASIVAGLKPADYRKDWINPVDLESKAKKKGMVSTEKYQQRPNISKEEFENDYKDGLTKKEQEILANKIKGYEHSLQNQFNITDLINWEQYLVKKSEVKLLQEKLRKLKLELEKEQVTHQKNQVQLQDYQEQRDVALKELSVERQILVSEQAKVGNYENELKSQLNLLELTNDNWKKSLQDLTNRPTVANFNRIDQARMSFEQKVETLLNLTDVDDLPIDWEKQLTVKAQFATVNDQVKDYEENLKNKLGISDLTNWLEQIAKQSDLVKANTTIANYETGLNNLEITDLTNWEQKIQAWKNDANKSTTLQADLQQERDNNHSLNSAITAQQNQIKNQIELFSELQEKVWTNEQTHEKIKTANYGHGFAKIVIAGVTYFVTDKSNHKKFEKLAAKLKTERDNLNTERAEHQKTYRSYLLEEQKATKLKNDLAFERVEHAKNYRLYLDEEKIVTDLTNDCTNLNAEIATKNTELNQKDNKIIDLSNNFNNLSNTLISERNDFSVKLAQKDTQIQNLTNDYNQLQVDKDQEITATKNLLTTEQTARVTEKANADKEIATLKAQLQKETAKCQTLAQTNTDLQTKFATISSQPTSCQENCCGGDYDRIKNELAAKEGEMVSRINDSLNLHLPENTNLVQVITIIKELIAKPPTIIDNNNHHEEATKNPLSFLVAVKTEDLAWLKGVLSQQLYTAAQEKLTKEVFTSYSQLAEVRNSLVSQQLSQSNNQFQLVSQQSNSLAKQKNILWLLLAIGLLGVAIITGKLRKSRILNKKFAQDNQVIKKELTAMRKEMRIFMSTMLNNKLQGD